ncbi:MAG: NADH-quinone oxidoreductase subunit C [Planctomycetota bacterium]|nr:MAG: NADH-quinone oxidoreductase subunit C [Planctomycetota bacterium]
MAEAHSKDTVDSRADDAIESLAARFPGLESSTYRGQVRVVIGAGVALEFFTHLKQLGFNQLIDVTCVDYLEYRGATRRYGLVYLLTATGTGRRLTVRLFVDDPEPAVPSISGLWRSANWLEREVWDMFGIRFIGHPDLRRLLMPEEFLAHPLRKDYPLQGRGERHNFPVLTREDG